jgi:anti-sigma B factor antagonist
VQFHSEVLEGIVVLKLQGRFDAYQSPQIADWLDAQITPQQARVLVDLSETQFIDSSALAVLVKGMKRCREAGGDLVVCGVVERVQVIFELTRLDKAFRMFPTRDEALHAFSA